MLHNTWMFCLIKFIFIYKNLSLHGRVTVSSSKTCGDCAKPHQFTEILIIHIDKDTTIIHGTLDTLLLNATAVSDFQNTLRRKQTMQ